MFYDHLKRISLRLFTRNVYRKNVYNWRDEGIHYPGFKYYPRNTDFKDPPYEPTKLFMIQRIKPLKGCPHWEKSFLKDFKLNGKISDIAIVKNIPEVNAKLWRIKHLIKVVPITFPNGPPTESNGTFLKENGELVVTRKLEPLKEKLDATENFQMNPRKMDGDTLRRRMLKKWLTAWDTTIQKAAKDEKDTTYAVIYAK
ncbi:39S ribosomal protein L30, mitochondrial isoform X2 [Agrilus planipennis]|uniref:Large ribosomal subunit protein uL30m n=1 Tax=Agrilus planipennis TaxID=224129 RepID=A0A1W4WXZ5_AGRPL|nr:39S ribosomal protein L30, mitochondrial isoform X2 [Agrilus planipennis]